MLSGTHLFYGLFNNLAIFIVLVSLYGFILSLPLQNPLVRKALLGLLFGVSALVCMTIRLKVAEGVIVDQRNAIIVLSTLFGGWIPGLITVALAAGYRAYLGGAGVFSGVCGTLLAFSAGLVLQLKCWKNRDVTFLFLGSIFATLVILPGFLLVGDLANGYNLLKKMALPYGVPIFIGIFLVGLLLNREDKRLRVEESVKVSERKYRRLYESLLDISYETDQDGRIQEISPSVEGISGYTPTELIGRQMAEFYVDPEQRQVFLQAIMKEGIVANYRVQLRRKDGSAVWMSITARLMRDDEGKILGIQGIARDITNLKLAEDEKESLESSLLQSRKMEAIGTLAGGIAHDFNNILAGIVGYTEMIRRELAGQAGPVVEQYLENVLAAADRANNLINQILTFSCQTPMELKAVAVRRSIEEVVLLIRASLPATIAIETHLNSEATVVADPVQIDQLLLNLCTNAGYAMKDKGGVLAISLEEATLGAGFAHRHAIAEPGKYAHIQVRDSGSGIPPEVLHRIFDPFFTTKPQGVGTGLGLALVHGIVSGLNGILEVESEEGKGTRFDIYLPIAGERPPTAADTAQDAVVGGTERIVYVDDDPVLIEIGNDVLTSLGYAVTTFMDSEEALRYLLEQPAKVDLVVSDLTMPKVTGLDLAQAIVDNRLGMPILICSGYTDAGSVEQARQAGVCGFLQKPFTTRSISRKVRDLLDQAAAAKQTHPR